MKKRILSLVLCLLMLVTSLPITADVFSFRSVAVEKEESVSLAELQKVYDAIAKRDEWEELYVNTYYLAPWYDQAEKILASPDSYTEETISATKNSLEREFSNIEYHTKGIALNKKSTIVDVGKTEQLKAILTPDNAADKVTWTSSNASAVKVSSSGLITAVAYSKTAVTITATSNGKSAVCSVKTNNPLGAVKLNFETKSIYDNESFVLRPTAVGKDSSASVTNPIIYKWSSANEKVAKVSDGFVTGIMKGTTKITVTATDGIATVKAECTVTVKELVPIVGLKAETMTNNGTISLIQGETSVFRVAITPETASEKMLKWESGDETVASITSSAVSGNICSATIKANKKGSATITYKATDGSGKRGSFTVQVLPLIKVVELSDTVKVISVDDKNVSIRASISPRDAGNQVLDWTTSNSDVCSVDRNGNLTPKKNGTCIITASTTDGSKISVSAKLRVAPRAASVSINTDSLGLKTGQTHTLTATTKTVANSTYEGYVEWVSDNPKVATVSPSGVVTAIYPGTARIRAYTLDSTEKVDTCIVTVVQPLEGISVPAGKTVAVGKTYKITPTFKPAYASNKKVTWSVDTVSVATVDQNGVVTAKKVGTATVTCKSADGGFVAKCKITVIIPTTSVKLSKTSATVNSGKNLSLSATVSPSNATDKTVKWKSSNTAVAKVSSAGVVTAVAGGSAEITATASGGQTAVCKITVIEPIKKVELNRTTAKLYVSQKYTFRKTVTPATATVKTVTWSSSNKAVAKVTSAGQVTALKKGTAIIKVKVDGFEASCTVTVVDKVSAKGVSLSAKEKDISLGGSFTLTPTLKPSNASNKNVTWKSSNTKIATVDKKGVVKGVAVGNAVISATTVDGGFTSKCTVHVCPKATGIRITQTSINLNKGKTYTLSVRTLPTDAIAGKIIWSSSNTKVATVNSNGVVKAVANGKATVTARTENGGLEAKCTVDVSIHVSKVTLNYEKLTMARGNTKQLLATVSPNSATDKTITWTSSNSKVATVAKSGVVFAKGVGETTITAKSASGKTAKCTVKVIQYVTNIQLSYASLNIKAGKTKLLSAIVKPDSATNKTIVWSSSNEKVAKVDKNGKITAVAGGKANIIAKSKDGKAQTVCVVNVEQTISKIKLEAEKLSVKIGATRTVKATVGPKTATDKKIKWSSSNKKIATVNSKGVVKGIAKGKVTITAKNSDGTAKAVCTVSVLKPATGVKLNKTKITIIKGKSTSITPSVKPSDASNKNVTWSSNNNDVVTVNSKGVITAKSTGYAEVTAKTKDGGFKAVCRINVIQPAKGMTLAVTKKALDIGEYYTLKAKFSPKDATNTAIIWSSSNKKVVKVNAEGLIKGIARGTAVITAKSVDGGFVSKCTVTVSRKVKSVSLNKSSLTLYLDKPVKLKATVTPSDATVKTLTWASSNTSVVTVSSNGTLTPKKIGTAKITVKTKDGGKKAYCTVKVERAVSSLKLSKTTLSLNENNTYKLTASISPTNATDKTVTWSSSNTKVATVDKNGTVKALSKGTAVITAKTSNGLSAKCTVTVTKPVEEVTLSYESINMITDEVFTLSATVSPADASDKRVKWTSSAPDVVDVQNGKLTALKPGTAQISVSAVNGVSASCVVTVKAAPESITLSKDELEMAPGETAELSAVVNPEETAEQTVTWESSDEDVAVVIDGFVTSLKEGTATVTVKTVNGLTASCKISVKNKEIIETTDDSIGTTGEVIETTGDSILTTNEVIETTGTTVFTTNTQEFTTVVNEPTTSVFTTGESYN